MNNIKQYITIVLILAFGGFSSVFSQEQPTDSLTYYTKIALENNPRIKSHEYTHKAYLEKISQAGAFQDAEFSAGIYTPAMDIVGGRSIANFSVMQELPWFGTRKVARTKATHLANAQDLEYQEVVNELILRVSIQWYTMQKLNEQLRNNQKNKALLEHLEQLAIRKYASATSTFGGMSDVLRIQLEMVELENNIKNTRSQLHVEKAKFNALLNREANEKISLGNKIHKMELLYSEEEILSAIETNNPLLTKISEEGLAYKAKAEMDRKKSYPSFGIGVEYMLIGKTNDPMFAMGNMNGKDMIMPMVSVSLPLFRKKYNAQQKESELWRKASEENFKNTYNALKSEYYSLKNQLENAERVIDLYEKQNTLAQTTYNLILQEFVAGQSDLTNVLQVQRQLLDYQLKKAESLVDYNTMLVSIQKLIAENR